MTAQVVLAGNQPLDEVYHEVQIATGKINNDMTGGAVSSGSRICQRYGIGTAFSEALSAFDHCSRPPG